MIRIATSLAAVCLFAPPAFRAQEMPSAGAIVTKYIQALGGEEALRKVTTRGSRGSIEVPTFGSYGSYQEVAKAPNLYLRITHFEGYGVSQRCFDGRQGWTEDPEYGIQDVTGARLSELRVDAEFQPALALHRLYPKMTVAGRTSFDLHDAYKVEATSAGGALSILWFDAGSGLLLAIESTETARDGQTQRARIEYGDYRGVDGLMVAHTLRYESPRLIWIVRRGVAHNIPIDPEMFEKPAH